MSFTTNMISTADDCDLLLSLAAKEKGDLDFRKLSLQRQRNSYALTAVEVEAELLAVTAELDALNVMIPTLPNGTSKDSNIERQKRLELRKFQLTQRRDDYGVVAQLVKEFDQARLEKELLAVQEFTDAVLERKAEL